MIGTQIRFSTPVAGTAVRYLHVRRERARPLLLSRSADCNCVVASGHRYAELAHVKGVRHIAGICGVDEEELRRAVRALKERLAAGVALEAGARKFRGL